MDKLKEIQSVIIEAGFELGSLKLQPEEPFTWASGYKMPVYNDNRLLLSLPHVRKAITEGLAELVRISGYKIDVVAGVATAGIPAATSLADALNLPLCYIRGQAKDHGTRNMIEGRLPDNAKVVIVEDLLSTGSSALNAVRAVRGAGACPELVLSVFSYQMQVCEQSFRDEGCQVRSLVVFSDLLELATVTGRINSEERLMLEKWHQDPFNWAQKSVVAKEA